MKWISKIEDFLCGTLLLGATGILMTHIFLRYFFSGGFPWAEEIVRFMFIWITFIGVAICVRKNMNISIDVIYNFINEQKQKILRMFIILVTLIFAIVFGKYGLDLVLFNLSRPQYSSALSLPMYYVYLVIPVGSLLMILHAIHRLIKPSIDLKDNKRDDILA